MKRESKLTSKGQVTIPGEIRRALRLREGDTVVFEMDERGAHLRLRQPENVFAEYEGAWREGEGMSAEEINAWLRELRGHDV